MCKNKWGKCRNVCMYNILNTNPLEILHLSVKQHGFHVLFTKPNYGISNS